MKTSAISAMILAGVCLGARAQLVLNSGDVFTYHFDTLPLITGLEFDGPDHTQLRNAKFPGSAEFLSGR
jgi:hypothetical protein